MFKNPNPDCKKECRFSQGCSYSTDVYYPPIYDKHGNNINPDGNVTSSSVYCSVCGKKWNSTTRYGETTYTEIQ